MTRRDRSFLTCQFILSSKELSTKGVEVVKADLEDAESLKTAFTGAYGVFGLTNCA